MRLVTDEAVPEVKITVECDEEGDVALKANGIVVLWVMGCFNGIRLKGCDPKELASLGFKMKGDTVAIV